MRHSRVRQSGVRHSRARHSRARHGGVRHSGVKVNRPVTPNGQYEGCLTGCHAEQAEPENIVAKSATLIRIWVACITSTYVWNVQK